MEKRNIQVSLQEAKDWYNCGNETLRLLALQAYNKEELESLDYNIVHDCLCKVRSWNTITLTVFSEKEKDKLIAFAKLSHIAEYLNEGWVPNWNAGTLKYSIYYDHPTKRYLISNNQTSHVGTIYFKSEELVRQAIKILGTKVLDNLFK